MLGCLPCPYLWRPCRDFPYRGRIPTWHHPLLPRACETITSHPKPFADTHWSIPASHCWGLRGEQWAGGYRNSAAPGLPGAAESHSKENCDLSALPPADSNFPCPPCCPPVSVGRWGREGSVSVPAPAHLLLPSPRSAPALPDLRHPRLLPAPPGWGRPDHALDGMVSVGSTRGSASPAACSPRCVRCAREGAFTPCRGG